VPRGTREHRRETNAFRVRGYHPLWLAFPDHSAKRQFCHSLGLPPRPSRAPQPPHSIGRRTTKLYGFRLLPFRSPLLREYSLFLRVLRCFSSPGSPRRPMDSAGDAWAFPHAGFPIRVSPDHSLLAAPRGLSQPATPFIGPWCQGIHRTPLVASFTQDGRNHIHSRKHSRVIEVSRKDTRPIQLLMCQPFSPQRRSVLRKVNFPQPPPLCSS